METIEKMIQTAIATSKPVTMTVAPHAGSNPGSARQIIDLPPSEYKVSTQPGTVHNFSVPMHQLDPSLCPADNPQPCRAVGPAKLKFTNATVWSANATMVLQAKESIKLDGGFKALSTSLTNALGCNNTFDIYADDSRHTRIKLFMALAEHEAFSARQTNQVIDSLLHDRFDLKEICCKVRVPPISWSIQRSDKSGSGFIGLLQTLLSCSELDATATLANILGLDLKYIFQNYNNGLSGQHGAPYRRLPYNLDSTDGTFSAKLQRECPILGYDGAEIAYIAEYRVYPEDVSFCVPVHYSEQGKSIGYYPIQAAMLNQCQLDEIGTEHVLFCLDPRLAIELDATIQDCRIKIAPLPVVTGHIGTNLEALPWNFFYGKNVTLIPAATPASMSAVGVYHNYLKNADAASVKVCPFWLLPYERGTIEQPPALNNTAEEQLLNNAVFLPEVESIAGLTKKILTDSLPYEKFVAWGKEIGFFHKKDEEGATATNFVAPMTLSKGMNINHAKDKTTLSISKILPPNGVSLVLGKKDAGKSMAILRMIKELVEPGKGFNVFEGGLRPRRCLLLDSETLPDQLFSRLEKLGLNDHPNLIAVSKLAQNQQNIWKNFNLLDPDHRAALITYAKKQNINYLFLDNVSSLIDGRNSADPHIMAPIFEWAQKAAADGLGIVIAHHLLEDCSTETVSSKILGSQTAEHKSHTVLAVIGQEEVLKQKRLENFKSLYSHGNFAVGIYVKSCKTAHELANHIFWFSEDEIKTAMVYKGKTDLDHNWIEDTPVQIAESSDDNEATDQIPAENGITDEDILNEATRSTKTVLTAWFELRKEGQTEPVQRKDIESKIPESKKIKGQTILNVMDKLEKEGLVQKHGDDQNRTYSFVPGFRPVLLEYLKRLKQNHKNQSQLEAEEMA